MEGKASVSAEIYAKHTNDGQAITASRTGNAYSVSMATSLLIRCQRSDSRGRNDCARSLEFCVIIVRTD